MMSDENVFNKEITDEDAINQRFGNISIENQGQLKVTGLSATVFGTTTINGIVATSADKAWIHASGSSKCVLVDENGRVVDEKEFGKNYIHFIIKDGLHVYTPVLSGSIVKYIDGESTPVCSKSPHYATGICMTRDGSDVLVCLVQRTILHINDSTQGEVHHIDMAGNTFKTYTKDEKDQTKLFTFPDRIAQNVNLDLCVVDVLDIDFSCRVVVVSSDSTIRFTYQGRPELDKTFFVGDIVCDSDGRIILTDLYNHSIHVLSSEGDFMKFLITADDGLTGPYSLALYDMTLWVGCKAGVVKLYKLKFD